MDIEMQKKFDDALKTLLNAKVLFPDSDNPNNTGIVTDIYFQPSRDLKKRNPLTFLSDDEIPDLVGNYPKQKTSPKILCRVKFNGYVHITEPKDLKLVDMEASDEQ